MAKKEKGLTPMMQQFFSLKAKHPDALMLFMRRIARMRWPPPKYWVSP